MVEAEAEAEIREIQRGKEAWLKRQKEMEEERERVAREREEMGVTWGMGECGWREGERRWVSPGAWVSVGGGRERGDWCHLGHG